MSNGTPECSAVWQYLLIMSDEITGLASGLQRIGEFHKDDELEPIAKWLDEVVNEFRERLENLTGWEEDGK